MQPASQPAASNLFSWDTFNRVTSHAAVTAGIDTTINGSNFADTFKASLLANIQGEVGKSTANCIGDQGIKYDTANSPLAEAGKIAAHGVTSGAIAEITGGKFAAGAAGGAMSELASSWSSQVFSNTEHQVALNKVLGGLAAVAVTGDQSQFDTGAERAEDVYRFNTLEHLKYLSAEAILEQISQDIAPIIDEADKQAKIETAKASALVASGIILWPSVPFEVVATSATINTLANGAYQWFDMSLPGNENKTWDYWGTASAVVTGTLSPGRGIWQNVGISMGAAFIVDGADPGKVGGAGGGALAGGLFGKYAPAGAGELLGDNQLPSVVYDFVSGVTSEFSSDYLKVKASEVFDKKGDKQ